MSGGKRIAPPETLDAIRHRAAEQLAALPEPLKALDEASDPYRVEIAPAVRALADEVDRVAPGAVTVPS
jgi:nicotinate phosphoribosyltransferase